MLVTLSPIQSRFQNIQTTQWTLGNQIVVHVPQCYSAMSKNKILQFVKTWIKGIRLSEASQTEKDKYCVVSLLCGIRKKKKEEEERTANLQKQRVEWLLPGAGVEVGVMGRCWSKGTTSYTMNKSGGLIN